jgi:hypothetical protein
MASSITGLRLYDYTGRYQMARPADINRSYTTPQSQFGPSYTVNGSAEGIDTNRLLNQSLNYNTNFNLQQVQPQALPALMNYGNKSLSFDSNLNADSVTRPYQDYLNSLAVTDKNFNNLMQQESFHVFNGRVGIKVTTDGDGNIDQVSLRPGDRDLRNGTPASATIFQDRTEITERAFSRFANAVPPTEGEEPIFLQNDLKTAEPKITQPVQPQTQLKPVNPFNNVREITQPTPFTPGSEVSNNNTLLQKLLRLQPPEVDTRVFGPDSQLTFDSARKLGNGAFDVKFSQDYKENVAHLRDHLALQAAALSQRSIQARDGFIPVSPHLPADAPAKATASTIGGMFENLNQLATSADTTEKKSSGGYIPFRMGGQGQGQQEGQNQEQQRRRTPFRAIA